MNDFPETAKFLTEDERAFVNWRLRSQGQVYLQVDADGGVSQHASAQEGVPVVEQRLVVVVEEAGEFRWEYVRAAFKDWLIWISIIAGWGVSTRLYPVPPPTKGLSALPPCLLTVARTQFVAPLYGISLFLPTIVRSLGYTSSTAQLMTVPIYVTAAILAILAAFWSDRVRLRSPFLIGGLAMAGLGFILCISSADPHVVYAGVFIAACGIYPAVPGHIVWLACNQAGSYKRSTAIAMQVSGGNLAGAMAANFYRAKDSPGYTLGHGLALGFVGAGILALVSQVWCYKTANAKRARMLRDGALERLTAEELARLGDKAPTFRYMY